MRTTQFIGAVVTLGLSSLQYIELQQIHKNFLRQSKKYG